MAVAGSPGIEQCFELWLRHIFRQGSRQLVPPEAGDNIRNGAEPDIQTGRYAPVGQVAVKFKAQQFFNFTHPRSQSCHGDTSQEGGLSAESVVHCFQSEKCGIPTTGSPIPTIRSRIPEPGSRIPTDGQIWPEQIGINGRFGSEYAHVFHFFLRLTDGT